MFEARSPRALAVGVCQWHTPIAETVGNIEEGEVKYSDYHQTLAPIDDSDEDEADEDTDTEMVVLLGASHV